jgi:hypothetical protein
LRRGAIYQALGATILAASPMPLAIATNSLSIMTIVMVLAAAVEIAVSQTTYAGNKAPAARLNPIIIPEPRTATAPLCCCPA